jgi:hypothetical protein
VGLLVGDEIILRRPGDPGEVGRSFQIIDAKAGAGESLPMKSVRRQDAGEAFE